MFEKITKTLSGLAFIKYINSLIDYVNTSDIDATRIKGQLDISNIPPAGLDNVIKVDTVTDMLALTVDDVQNGDTVMIIGVTPQVQYQVVDDTKLGTMDAFQEYAAGTATKALADINGNNIHTTYGKLAGNNTWTGNNYWNGSAIFNANLTIRGSATAAGSAGIITLGEKPSSKTEQCLINAPGNGNLIFHASENAIISLQSGSVYQWSIESDEANTKTSAYLHSNLAATYTPATGVVWEGNAKTATKLKTARTITANLASRTAGSFDGSANITVGVTGTLPIANGGTGATTAAAARTALGCAPAYTYSTTDLTAGSSALTTGTLYIVYE